MTKQILLLIALGIAVPAHADVSDSGNLTIGGQGVIAGTMTVQGGAFSVGGSTFAVLAGTAQVGGLLRVSSLGILWNDGTKSTTAASGAISAQVPTRRVFPSTGSWTYTTPANALQIQVRMVAGGGGGGGCNSGCTTGGTGGTTVFGSTTVIGGTGGLACENPSTPAGGLGGTGGVGQGGIRSAGGVGQSGIFGADWRNPCGGSTLLGQCSSAPRCVTETITGPNGQANTGVGGSGGCITQYSGAAGGGGEYYSFVLNSPAPSYSITVGAGGAASTGCVNVNGGMGGSGIIIVDEFY